MKLRTALDKVWLQSLPIMHKVLYHFSCFLRFFLFIVLTSICFKCVISLQYSLNEASPLIEILSQNWDRVRDHLNQVARLPTYRFHTREVHTILKLLHLVMHLSVLKIPFSFSPIHWTNVFGWTLPIWLGCSSYIVSSIFVSTFSTYTYIKLYSFIYRSCQNDSFTPYISCFNRSSSPVGDAA